jgi:hypothetical protein
MLSEACKPTSMLSQARKPTSMLSQARKPTRKPASYHLFFFS